MNIQHSSRSDAWGTPPYILNAVRQTVGCIDFDPASSAAFNEQVQATEYFTEGALERPWPVKDKTVFLNPPGGKTGNRSNTVLFWQRLLEFRGEFKHAVFLAFSLEALQTTQKPERASIMDFPFCVPNKRVRFLYENGLVGPSPSHSNVIVYVPGTLNYTHQFITCFSAIGAIKP